MPDPKKHENQFFNALRDIFVGAKVEGYRILFEENGQPKLFAHQGLQVTVQSFLYTPDRQYLADGYRRYWFDQIGQVMETLLPSV
jgi:hypothetical protein